jgi:putative hemolysin
MTHKYFLFFVLLCCSAFFSASETTLFSLSRIQIHRFRTSKSKAAQQVVKCLRKPRKWLATILLGNELVNVCMSIIGASIVNHYFFYSIKTQTIIAVVIITPIVLLGGEIIPKNLAIRFSPTIAPIMVIPLSFFYRIVRPFRFVLAKVADAFVTWLGGHPEKAEPMIVEEEFRRLVDLGSREGVIVEEEREMIHKVFEFSDKVVSEIMTQAGHIFTLPIDLPYEQMLSEIKATLFSRIPLYEGEHENIIGILHVRDLFSFHRKRLSGGEQSIRSIIRTPLFVEPRKRLEELLKDFQQSGVHMAIVKEEGRIVGLVTMDDVLEELFGEIEK